MSVQGGLKDLTGHPPASALEILSRLRVLESERYEAEQIGLMRYDGYRRDLEAELAGCRSAFVGAAVTEIAVLLADLGHPRVG